MIAYKNRNTDQVQVFPEKNPRLEMLNEWEKVDNVEVSREVAAAADRAAAERASIQAAAAIRFDSAQGAAAAGISEARKINTDADGGPGQPIPTLSQGAATPTQASSLVGLLDKQNPARRMASTSFEENKAAAEREIKDPPRDGVLKRAKRDQREGMTQIGSNPGEHPTVAATHERTRADADGRQGEGEGEPTRGEMKGEGGSSGDKPAKGDSKDAWVQYAVSQGMAENEANGKTKQQLIEQYGE